MGGINGGIWVRSWRKRGERPPEQKESECRNGESNIEPRVFARRKKKYSEFSGKSSLALLVFLLMSNEKQEPTNRPIPGGKVERWGYHLRVKFHPEIRLENRAGFDFAKELSDFINPAKVDLQSETWYFTQPLGPSPDSYLTVTITTNTVQMHVAYPTYGKEWYEKRYELLLAKFKDFFKPELILESSAMVRGVLGIDGDARVFLAQHVMNIDSARTDSFGRPIHLVGIRFFFPPFKKKTPSKRKAEVTDWQVDIKAESLLEDPSKLFLEADADWRTTREWNEGAIIEEIERLETVSKYLEENVVAFLQKDPGETQDSEDPGAPQ